MELKDIDVRFDVRSDCPEPKPGSNKIPDPDIVSPMLKAYHQLLWSKPLPNGEIMELETGKNCYLKWHDIYLGSDSIAVTFRHYRNPHYQEFKAAIPDYDSYMADVLKKICVIGGYVIFPQSRWSMNCARGCHRKISDRWDLTLECIRRFYAGETSPLDSAMERARDFFELFVDFKGYVDFFLFQDCVDEDYNVKFWLDTPLFVSDPYPRNLNEYLAWVASQIDFVNKRNNRIVDYCQRK